MSFTVLRSLYRRVRFGKRIPLNQIHKTWNNDNRVDSQFENELSDLLSDSTYEGREVYHRVKDTYDGNALKSYVNSERIRIYSPSGILDYFGKFKLIKIRPSAPLEGRIIDIPQNIIMGPFTGTTDIHELYQKLSLKSRGKYSSLTSKSRIVSSVMGQDGQVHEFTSYEGTES